MVYKKKIAWICIILFSICLWLLVSGIESRTVTYHVLNDANETFDKTYYLPFGQKVISLETPRWTESDITEEISDSSCR